MGSPPQNVSAIFDTGSRDLIINSANSDWCKQGKCTQNGAYDPLHSTTEEWFADGMQVRYTVGAGNGSWLTDDIHIGGMTLKDYQFGLMNTSDNPQSVWGFGLPDKDEWLGLTGALSPNDTLRAMAGKGAIKSASAAWKLKESASLVLGGVDKSLYTGDLYAMPLVPDAKTGNHIRLLVNMTVAKASGPNFNVDTPKDYPSPVAIDSGEFDSVLDSSFVDPLWKALKIDSFTIKQKKLGTCPCSLANNTANITFGFGDFTLDLPLSAFVVRPAPGLLPLFGAPDLPEGTCMFTINPNNQWPDYLNTIGGLWQENVYTVFDAESYQLAFAKLATKTGPSDIREIAPGMAGMSSINATVQSSVSAAPVATASPTSTAKSAAGGRDTTCDLMLAFIMAGIVWVVV